MDISKPEQRFMNISPQDSEFGDLLDSLKDSAQHRSHHLSLFLGVFRPDKKEALERISDSTGLSVETISFNNIILKSEKETYQNLDRLFEKYQNTESILYFKDGDILCGVYTGFTHSHVKYASPQERYFLKKVQEFEGIVIVDVTEYSAADKTLRRAAGSTVSFNLPDSKLKRFMWHLKNYTFHGFQLRSKRPDAYGEVPGNF